MEAPGVVKVIHFQVLKGNSTHFPQTSLSVFKIHKSVATMVSVNSVRSKRNTVHHAAHDSLCVIEVFGWQMAALCLPVK